MESVVLKTDGNAVRVSPKNNTDFQLDELKEIVGGYIEILRLNSKLIMVVNEEGKLLGLPENSLATTYCLEAGYRDIIVGDVLVCDLNMVR